MESKYVVFGGWLPTSSMMFSRFTHIVFFHFGLHAFGVTFMNPFLKSNVIKMYLCMCCVTSTSAAVYSWRLMGQEVLS